MSASATITRTKSYATPGRAARFAWKWIYTVTFESDDPNHAPFGLHHTGEPVNTSEADTLSQARGLARRAAQGGPIDETWR